jgi:hypothetical protein
MYREFYRTPVHKEKKQRNIDFYGYNYTVLDHNMRNIHDAV